MTVPIVPSPAPSGAKVTVPPEEVRGLPFASLRTIVRMVVLVPLATSAGTADAIVLVAPVAGPGSSATAIVFVKATPSSRGTIVTGPAAVPAV